MSLTYPPEMLALALFSGLAMSFIGVGYRAAQARQVSATQIICIVCLAGVSYFAYLSQGRSWPRSRRSSG